MGLRHPCVPRTASQTRTFRFLGNEEQEEIIRERRGKLPRHRLRIFRYVGIPYTMMCMYTYATLNATHCRRDKLLNLIDLMNRHYECIASYFILSRVRKQF